MLNNTIKLITLIYISSLAALANTDHNLQLFIEIERDAYIKSNPQKISQEKRNIATEIYQEKFLDLLPTTSFAFNRSIDNDGSVNDSRSASLNYNINDLVFFPLSLSKNKHNRDFTIRKDLYEKLKFKQNFREKYIELSENSLLLTNVEKLFNLEAEDFKKKKKLRERGAISKLDFLRAQNSVESAKQNLFLAMQRADKEKRNFLTYFGTDESLEETINKYDEMKNKKKLILFANKTLSKLQEFKVNQHFEYEQSSHNKKILELSKFESANSYLPNFGLGYSKNIDTNTELFGLTASISLNNLLKDSNHFKSAQNDYKIASYSLSEIEKTLSNKKNSLINVLIESVKKYEYSVDSLKRYKEILSLSRKAYEKGKIESSIMISDWQAYVNNSNRAITNKHQLYKAINNSEFFIENMSGGAFLFL